MDGTFPQIYSLPGATWNTYIFDTLSMQPGADYVDCGAHCILHSTATCQFFVVLGSNCYFGSYTNTELGIVTDLSNALTYHTAGE
jgi:hypothetical protein